MHPNHRQHNKQIKYDHELDTSGLLCPLPLLKTKLLLQKIPKGEVVRVISTDPSSVLDFKVFAATTGYDLLTEYQENGHYIFLIRKTA